MLKNKTTPTQSQIIYANDLKVKAIAKYKSIKINDL